MFFFNIYSFSVIYTCKNTILFNVIRHQAQPILDISLHQGQRKQIGMFNASIHNTIQTIAKIQIKKRRKYVILE